MRYQVWIAAIWAG